MTLYRIAREKYAADLTGNGGLLSSARWHSHMPVIYTSVTSSTCILEKLVHLLPEEIHHDLTISTLHVPDGLASERLPADQLPEHWKDYPAPPLLQRIGNAWLQNRSSVLLYVPSVVDPFAENVLINPLHPDAGGISIIKTLPFRYDERLMSMKAK